MDTTPRMPTMPRQERARATRARLLDAVEQVVAAEGSDAVTTTRIAAQTGVAVGTIYRYFDSREALLLEAYDATVARIVEECRDVLDALPPDQGAVQVARQLLGGYLAAAEAIPAHAGLLRAMRAVRPVEADRDGSSQAGIAEGLLRPFFARFGIAGTDAGRLAYLTTLLGTLVDLYLVTASTDERRRLHGDIEAHMLLALERTIARS